ncbi:MAG: prepilin-type N-terminal cleavage/methylation domain-containing protein, partial [Firmicutes bacterium]|nr:prepilin-type N-terminal cleavage/methylation domain-containing protein [Bacillota bacterium]
MKNKKGFTLIELIAVLVVLSILIASSVAVFINI